MGEFKFMLIKVIMFVLLAIPGYLLVKTKRLKTSDSHSISTILLYIGLPFMILSSTLGLTLSTQTIIDIALVTLIFVLAEIALSLISKVFTKTNMFGGVVGKQVCNNEALDNETITKQKNMARFCMMFPNNGFIGIPLAAALFPIGHPLFAVVAYSGVLNVLTNVTWPTYGSYMVTGDKNHISAKGLFTNFVLIAFILGVILNLLDVAVKVPEILEYSNHFKGIVVALAMTVLGMKFADIQITKLFKSMKTYFLSFVRLIISPVLVVGVLLIIRLFAYISDEVIIASFIAFAMPTAAMAPTIADKFKIDSEDSVLYTLGSTLFSVITIPVLYYLLLLII